MSKGNKRRKLRPNKDLHKEPAMLNQHGGPMEDQRRRLLREAQNLDDRIENDQVFQDDLDEPRLRE